MWVGVALPKCQLSGSGVGEGLENCQIRRQLISWWPNAVCVKIQIEILKYWRTVRERPVYTYTFQLLADHRRWPHHDVIQSSAQRPIDGSTWGLTDGISKENSDYLTCESLLFRHDLFWSQQMGTCEAVWSGHASYARIHNHTHLRARAHTPHTQTHIILHLKSV